MRPTDQQIDFTHRLAGEILQDFADISEKLRKYKNTLNKHHLALSTEYINQMRDASNPISATLFRLNVDKYILEKNLPDRIIKPKKNE